MSIYEAYCIQLNRVVSITEARTEFLNLYPCKRFQFLCSTESCRIKGVKITGVNYDHFPDEIKQSPHFKYLSKNNIAHSADCQWNQTKIEPIAGESDEEYNLRKVRSKLHDFIDEFQLPEDDIGLQSEVTNSLSTTSQSKINKIISNQHNQAKRRYIKTNQLIRLVEAYLDAKKNLSEKEFLNLPLKVANSNIRYLYQYFRRTEKAIQRKQKCVCIAEVEYTETDKWLYFKLQKPFKENENSPEIPIYLGIKKIDLENYHYRRVLYAHIESNKYKNKYFKIYFIPQEKDFNIKKMKNKDGKEIELYFFEINNLNLFCLFNYNYLRKKKQSVL
ncbi:hypothetical protein ACERCG_08765 [Mannheimia sp. E30BD]|uniref:hypothetical protein n=1 Tax=Mannheimia sp. E30BD TaxID=3278708 RepID=UPI00359CCF67